MTLSVDPELNVRLFPSGSLREGLALQARLPGLRVSELGAFCALLEGLTDALAEALDEAAERAGARGWRFASRYLLTGSYVSLRAACVELAEERARVELRAALLAFQVRQVAGPDTRVMGVLNVTPDSFSDGGRWLDVEAAVARGLQMVEEGAEILDIGGESTRPGAVEVPVDEELRRVLPVVERLRSRTRATLSIDTRKAAVAEACLDAGADWINDVSGLEHDPRLAAVVAARPGRTLVLMHSRSRPADERYSTEYDQEGRPVYDDVVADTMRWLRVRLRRALEAGVAPECLWIDPGFGFGKTFEQNVELLRRLEEYHSIGAPVLVGTSRKSSVGKLLGDLPPDQRLEGTAATVAWAVARGAAAVRVHDVREMARVVRATRALAGGAANNPLPGRQPE